MKIVLVHAIYQQRGGEEEVLRAERDLLRDHGHEVRVFTIPNAEMVGYSGIRQAMVTHWNRDAYRRLRDFLRADPPAVAHFHNTFPILSPAVYYAAHAERVPVVQTLHNYRLICTNGLLFRDGRVCEECIGKAVPWPAVVHGSYRGSRSATAVVAGMLTAHRLAGTWRQKVDLYIALTEFARQKYIAGGLPAERLVVKPNFVPDPGFGDGERGDYGLFVGRLSREKGVSTMIEAWRRLPDIPLKIVGGGPMAEELESSIREAGPESRVELTGFQPREEVLRLMRKARFLVFPSEWYEGAPRVVLEAFACGLPVIGSRLGAMTEMLEHGRTGLHFEPGDATDLARQVRAGTLNGSLARMGVAARQEYEARYSADMNYGLLMEIYRSVAEPRPTAVDNKR
jgi:glycosyltransferase involved in cell wall biosynthesis